ncbi:phage tail protein [Vibrio alginolyticus]|uniref:phage tail-collar fiber domain-containing protein n=1 Tax=Vibrio alginolyticus TaxID=663 RepID=UPI001F54C58C|nr:phage tail protein [Vibrio alginolyticus]
MANTTDKSILTAAGKALLAQLNAEEKPLIIDKMMFANVPNRPEFPQPDDVVPTDDIVHQEQVEQRGRLSADSVIYSTTLTSDVGPFEFNWTGAYCSEYGVLVTIDHHALTPKTADEPGVAGNTLVRSVVLEYKDIAEITNITVDASSWQYNATDRMKKMDSDVAQSIIDQNGKDWFIEDGFLVTPSGSAYNIKAGAGYVSGNRVSMEFDRSVQVPNKPSFIYIDAHREGTPTGEQVTLFDFVITAEEKDDYIDSSTGKDIPHFVCKIAEVLADGSVSDLRPEGESASRSFVIDQTASPWAEGSVVVSSEEVYIYLTDKQSPAYKKYYFSPVATEEEPVVMGSTPIGDDNFKLFKDTVDVEDFIKGDQLTKSAIEQMSLYCRVNGAKGRMRGQYTLDEDIELDFDIDAYAALVITDNTIFLGRDTNYARDNVEIKAPKVTAKTALPVTEQRVGVVIKSITNSKIYTNRIKGFYKGLMVCSKGAATCWNDIYLPKLDNNYINFAIETFIHTEDPAYLSYVNENVFYGGNFYMKPSEDFDENRTQFYANDRAKGINGNTFIKPCLELPTYGAGQPTNKFLIAENGFSENTFIGVRTEGIGEFIFDNNSNDNFLSFGSQSSVHNVKVIETNGAGNNHVKRIGKNGEARGLYYPICLTNSLDKERPIMDFIDPIGGGGVHNRNGLEDNYTARFTHDSISIKNKDDVNPRLMVSPRGRRVSFGSGTSQQIDGCIPLTLVTRAVGNDTNYQFSPPFIFPFRDSELGVNVVEAKVVAMQPGTGKTMIGYYTAIVNYDSSASGDYQVVREIFVPEVNDFERFDVMLANFVGVSNKANLRVNISAVDPSTIECVALINISSPNYAAN